MSLNKIKTLRKAKKCEKALASLEELLARHRECPHLWNLRGDPIQLLETQDGPPLSEAATCYKTALRLNPNNLETLESLAHFYDAVEPKAATEKRYAGAYIVSVTRSTSGQTFQ